MFLSIRHLPQKLCLNSNNNPVALNWDTEDVTDMSYMFYNTIFSGDISNWDTKNVTNMYSMFRGSQFNKNISSWNTGSVTRMGRMFDGNTVFNYDLSGWCVGSVSDVVIKEDNTTSFSSTLPSNYRPDFGTANNCPPVAP